MSEVHIKWEKEPEAVREKEKAKGKVLVVDDEINMLKAMVRVLHREGFEVLTAETGGRALELLENNLVDVILLDIRLPDINGVEVLRQVKSIDPEVPVIMMTGYASVQNAVDAMKAGAFEYLTKPFTDPDIVPLTVRRAYQFKQLREENLKLEGMLSGQLKFTNMVAASASMQRILRVAQRLAGIDSTVLITGESGTGKEVLARTIHFSGPRRDHRFVPIDCGAIPQSIIESELFGHMKGAFTGAANHSPGLLKMADKGTAFLDEIGDLPLEMQTKLLRFLQEREIRPVGGANPEAVDVRVIAATNKDLAKLVEEGRFREDLYYRLNVVTIELPPLRDRKDDIPALVGFFLEKYNTRFNRKVSLSPEAFDIILNYHWPGNIRQLENLIIQLVSLCPDDVIRPEDLPGEMREPPPAAARASAQSPDHELQQLPLSIEAYERFCLERAIRECGGNVVEAAKVLNIGKSTLYRKIKELNIDVKSLS